MAAGYTISDKSPKNVWLVLTKDGFVADENRRLIEKISLSAGVDPESVSYFSRDKADWTQISDLLLTPGFFGQRLIVITGDYSSFNDEDISRLTDLAENCDYNHLAAVLTYSDGKKLKTKKFEKLSSAVSANGLVHIVDKIDDKYLRDMIISRAKKENTVLSKPLAEKIVNNIGEDVGLLVNEVAKYCAACGYSEITEDIVEKTGAMTVEASVFDMIELICKKRPVEAIKKLNNLFYLKTDEISILGALSSGFVDMHRCKLAQLKQLPYTRLIKDFEKSAKPYRYQKATNNSASFTLAAIEEILDMLLKADISMKTTPLNNKQTLYVLVVQIIARGMR